jgi:hypothetical protein
MTTEEFQKQQRSLCDSRRSLDDSRGIWMTAEEFQKQQRSLWKMAYT